MLERGGCHKLVPVITNIQSDGTELDPELLCLSNKLTLIRPYSLIYHPRKKKEETMLPNTMVEARKELFGRCTTLACFASVIFHILSLN